MSDTADMRFIKLVDGKYRIRFPRSILPKRWYTTCTTLEEAQRVRDDFLNRHGKETAFDSPPQPLQPSTPTIIGLTNHQTVDTDALWRNAIHGQSRLRTMLEQRWSQRVVLPHEPCAIAFLSDTHFGGAGTDYESAKRDAEIIQRTPGMYAIFHGDGMDNWVVGKLQRLQREQAMPFTAEVHLFASWLNTLRDRLIVVVPGNHDNWTTMISGVDMVRDALRSTTVLYDPNQVVFTLALGNHVGAPERRIVIRHKWRFGSIFNPTHGIEVGWDRGDIDYDIAVGGHTHIGTVCRPFWRHHKKRFAVLTGTYKILDRFGDEVGFASPNDRGCGAMVFDQHGNPFWTENLTVAAEFLNYLRDRFHR